MWLVEWNYFLCQEFINCYFLWSDLAILKLNAHVSIHVTCAWHRKRSQCHAGNIFDKLFLLSDVMMRSKCNPRIQDGRHPPFGILGVFFYLSNHMHMTHQMRIISYSLQCRHNEHDSVSNHQPHDCFLNRLFRRRSKKTSKLHVTGLCAGNSPGTGEFPAQMATNAENVSIWWRHHVAK